MTYRATEATNECTETGMMLEDKLSELKRAKARQLTATEQDLCKEYNTKDPRKTTRTQAEDMKTSLEFRRVAQEEIHNLRVAIALSVSQAADRKSEVREAIIHRRKEIAAIVTAKGTVKQRAEHAESKVTKITAKLEMERGKSSGASCDLLRADLGRLQAAATLLGI